MNRIQRLLTLLLLVCGMITGLWASSIPGALSGRFTINASGDKVQFSQGNLQYVGTWQFAENQWDCFSTSQYNDHRDLFGWGTGDAPNKVSTYNGDYGTFTDWGTNAITNGGNTENSGWRTLTIDEWVYLFYSRENAATLFGFGSVNGVNGLIILPDNWTTPEGASFSASTTLGLTNYGSYYYNGNEDNYSHNTYTAEQWAVMESAGAVFLPAAAYRHGGDSNIQYTYQGGFYWSSTPYDSNKAYYLNFYYHSLDPQFKEMRYGGRPVRLVRSSLEKDAEGNYLLSSADDWKLFATLVNSGTNAAANAKMTADINLGDDQTMIGTEEHPYQGTFVGQGHRLTIAYNVTENYVAPFRYIANSTISNIHIEGTIKSTMAYAAGVVAAVHSGTANLSKCYSSIQFNGNSTEKVPDWEYFYGGLVGQVKNNGTQLNLNDCMYDGNMTVTTTPNSAGANFIGVIDHAHANLTNCLATGTFSNMVHYNSGYHWYFGTGTFTNTYYLNANYTQTDHNDGGMHTTSDKLADGTIATALQNGRAEEVWVQDPETNQPMLKIFANKNLILGDANDNGEVEIGDVTSVLTLMATPEATGYNNQAADANGNGEIEIGDVTTILTIMAGGE